MLDVAPWLSSARSAGPAPLALGTMNFGKRTPAAEAAKIMARALERGIALFDTANLYNDGESERIVGEAIKERREQVLIATKVGLWRKGNSAEGLSRQRVLAACDESLRRLGTDYIDIYYLHAPDPRTPITETLEAIAALLQAGKIRHLGVSNLASWQVLNVMHGCKALGIAPPRISQVIYNLLVRQIEVEYVAFTRAHPIHTTVYNALAGGLLTGKHALGQPAAKGSRFDGNSFYQRRYWSERFFALVESYAQIASEAEISLLTLSYAWLASRPASGSVLVGPATVEQLDDAIDACARALDRQTLARIDQTHRAFLGTDASYAR